MALRAVLVLCWLSVVDGGVPAPAPSPPPGDAEVVDNLELLESLDELVDLELLEVLSR